ncbi:MAG: hypothetical protein JWQ25_1684 [Daejeonella sp.]|nr:hypothetical protein [Daejeonella sp.]
MSRSEYLVDLFLSTQYFKISRLCLTAVSVQVTVPLTIPYHFYQAHPERLPYLQLYHCRLT